MPPEIIYFLYRVLLIAAFPFLVLYVFFRGIRDSRYFRRLIERFGFLPPAYERTVSAAIWLHAVSVGEVVSSLDLIRRLRAQNPLTEVFISCSTLAGMQLAEQKASDLAAGIFYAPLDYCFAVRRVLRTIRPLLVVVLETEIWPNLYREAKRGGCGLLIVNGRISQRAFPKYRRFRWFFEAVLQQPDAILAQSERDRDHYLQLGAPPDRITVNGNLKYDFDAKLAIVPEIIQEFIEANQPAQIWIAASTMPPALSSDPDEDDVVIDAFSRIDNGSRLLILAPRKPERFDLVEEKLKLAGIPYARRSRLPSSGRVKVLLLDSIGELSSLFSLADAVFVGGSLAARGGHNILEPAFFGKPTVIGPHMENFADIADVFVRGGAVHQIQAAEELAPAIESLFGNPAMGGRARILAQAQSGASGRAAERCAALYDQALPRTIPRGIFKLFLWLAGQLWRIGGERKRSRQLPDARRLRTPVISVGNLGMGGSGKTPFVATLVRHLAAQGHRPAILTRGYGRSSPERRTVLAAGATASVSITGDEAQILLRECNVPIGIGADRFKTGQMVEERFQPTVFLLDDGFQHARLSRDLDLVLIDALDPFAGGALFPLGRLREPLPALARADAFVITRAEPGRAYEGIRTELRRYNAAAPIYRARVVPHYWSSIPGGDRLDPSALQDRRCAAFCGLANPGSFWRTLTRLGYLPSFQWVFGDHHQYRPVELTQLAVRAKQSGASVLLCTEKDAMNLPRNAAQLIEPLLLYWLKIGLEVEDHHGFKAQIGTIFDR
ncbi:MAG TPA: tetraacyldisaccharide 4'-kinase [Bryobacteraceae bacterium]|nr:tetraacyldisaccharide 4'-kinase [Bryobacteraceae bacterium]